MALDTNETEKAKGGNFGTMIDALWDSLGVPQEDGPSNPDDERSSITMRDLGIISKLTDLVKTLQEQLSQKDSIIQEMRVQGEEAQKKYEETIKVREAQLAEQDAAIQELKRHQIAEDQSQHKVEGVDKTQQGTPPMKVIYDDHGRWIPAVVPNKDAINCHWAQLVWSDNEVLKVSADNKRHLLNGVMQYLNFPSGGEYVNLWNDGTWKTSATDKFIWIDEKHAQLQICRRDRSVLVFHPDNADDLFHGMAAMGWLP